MAGWDKHDLTKIGQADDFHISPLREDGVTYGLRLGSGLS